MNLKALLSFWNSFEKLPVEIQELARRRYHLWKTSPFHASLQFKEVRAGVWSVRINEKYRALAEEQDNVLVWFWIGSHNDYETRV